MAKKIPVRHQNEPRPKLKVKFRKDDVVKVIAGKDKGKTGRVLDLDRRHGKVLVEAVSLVKRHTRPNPSQQIKGGIAERESYIDVSNIMILTSAGQTTRISYRLDGEGSTARRTRIARKTGEILDKKG